MLKSVLVALGFCFFNLISAIIIYRIAMKKDWQSFMKLVFGSMLVRFFLTAVMIWVGIVYIKLDQLPFALTFLISSFVLLLVEILYINYRSNLVNLQNNFDNQG